MHRRGKDEACRQENRSYVTSFASSLNPTLLEKLREQETRLHAADQLVQHIEVRRPSLFHIHSPQLASHLLGLPRQQIRL